MLDEVIAEVKARVADVVSHTNSTSVNDEKAIAWVLAAVRDVALVILDGCGHGSPYGHEAKYDCKVCEVYSKLNRLLPKGSGNPP